MFDRWQEAYDHQEPDYWRDEPEILNVQDTKEVTERFSEIVQMLCTSGELNLEYLDDCLGQICKILNIQYSPNSPLVERLDVRFHLTPIN